MRSTQSSGFYINYWAGDKGGVGKSWCARLDAQRHVDRNQKFWLVDTDKREKSTYDFYPEFALKKDVFFSEVPELRSVANPHFEAAIERPVVANCQAGSNDSLLAWIKEKQVSKVAQEKGIRLRYFFVSDLCNASLNRFKETVREFKDHLPLIFVVNRGLDLTDGAILKSDKFHSFLKQNHIPLIQLGKFDLNWRKVIEGENAESSLLSWGEARDYSEFGILGQAEVQAYLEDFYGQVDDAERLADLAFSQRVSSTSRSSTQTKTISTSSGKPNSSNG